MITTLELVSKGGGVVPQEDSTVGDVLPGDHRDLYLRLYFQLLVRFQPHLGRKLFIWSTSEVR